MIAAIASAAFGLVGGAGGMLSFLGPIFSFFGTKPGKIVGVGLGIAIAIMVAYNKGETAANEKCEAAALRAELQAKDTDLNSINDRLGRSRSVINELQRGDSEARDRITQLEEQLAKQPISQPKQEGKGNAKPRIVYLSECKYPTGGLRNK